MGGCGGGGGAGVESIMNQPQNAMTELERSFDLTLCSCEECMTMLSRRVGQEFEHYMAKFLSQSATCISRHQDFELHCSMFEFRYS